MLELLGNGSPALCWSPKSIRGRDSSLLMKMLRLVENVQGQKKVINFGAGVSDLVSRLRQVLDPCVEMFYFK